MDEQFKRIDKKVSKILGKFGYSTRQALPITQAPIELGGVGCPPSYAMASSGYITHLIKNWRVPTELTGGTFRVVVSRFQQAAGISKPIFEHPSISLTYVSGVICQAIRRYLVDIDGVIKLTPNYVPEKLRVNDIAIMDLLFQSELEFNEVQRKQINSCRLYLNITYLSEVCNIEGTHIIDGVYEGDKTNLICEPLQKSIYQPYPGQRS